MKDNGRNIGQVEPDQAGIPDGFIQRKCHGRVVFVRPGGELVGNSGYTRLEVNVLGVLAEEIQNQHEVSKGIEAIELFKMD